MSDDVATSSMKEVTAESVSAVVSVLRIQPKDVLVFSIEVGNAPPNRVREILSDHKGLIRSVIPEDIKILLVPMRDGVPSGEITVLRSE